MYQAHLGHPCLSSVSVMSSRNPGSFQCKLVFRNQDVSSRCTHHGSCYWKYKKLAFYLMPLFCCCFIEKVIWKYWKNYTPCPHLCAKSVFILYILLVLHRNEIYIYATICHVTYIFLFSLILNPKYFFKGYNPSPLKWLPTVPLSSYAQYTKSSSFPDVWHIVVFRF